MIAACQFPALALHYDKALRAAVQFILEKWEPLGIVACGSIIRGHPNAASDFDLHVIIAQAERQRVQRWFNGVPVEIFVNPPAMLERYFEEEQQEARPMTAHMLATGFVILERDSVIQPLLDRARELLDQPPQPADFQLTMARYAIADQYENARDMADSDPATCHMLLSGAVRLMLNYFFQARGQFIPRDKELISHIERQDQQVGGWLRRFYADSLLDEKLRLAEQLADHILGVRGFFEWETPLESTG